MADVALRDSAAPDRRAVAGRAAAASPAVEEARQRMLAADAQAAVMRGVRWPELKAIGAYVQRGGGSGDFTDEWNGGLQLSYPLFTGGAASRRVARADASRRAAAGDLELATLRVEEQVDRALAELAESAARVSSLREAVAAHAAVAGAERLRLEAGAGIQADYLAAEADLLGARAELARTEYRRIAARIEIARLAGRLDLAWLTASLESQP
jgi:outer membrane protein TolC